MAAFRVQQSALARRFCPTSCPAFSGMDRVDHIDVLEPLEAPVAGHDSSQVVLAHQHHGMSVVEIVSGDSRRRAQFLFEERKMPIRLMQNFQGRRLHQPSKERSSGGDRKRAGEYGPMSRHPQEFVQNSPGEKPWGWPVPKAFQSGASRAMVEAGGIGRVEQDIRIYEHAHRPSITL